MNADKRETHMAAPARIVSVAMLALLVSFIIATNANGDAPAASFTAVDFAWQVTGGTATSVHIEPGQSVAFDYPSGAQAHNADFGALAPSSCTQTSGTDSGSVPPLPAHPTPQGWAGSCTFTGNQTYSFFCDFHSGMRGTIVVGTGGSSGGGGGGSGGGATNPNTQNTLTSDNLKISRTQHSRVVRGSVDVSVADSKFTADAYASTKSLSTSTTTKRIGHLIKSSLATGRATFSISLNRAARKALKSKGKLSVSLKLKLTDPAGVAVNATRRVTLKS
jgi:plastocyanin